MVQFKFLKMTKKNLIFALMFISVLVSLVARPEQEKNTTEAEETLVDVGGFRLNFRIIRGQSPIVLFESGGGMDSSEWANLVKILSGKTAATIVTYDRAGFGKSDLPDIPYDMRKETAWLFKGLKKLGVERNLILVGHSYGGWLIRLAASMYPDKISGMVFVDPFTHELVDILGIDYLKDHPMSGKLPFDTSQPERLSKYQRALVRMISDGLAKKTEIMRKTILPEGVPVRLITAGRDFLPKPEEYAAWRRAHKQVVSKIKGAKLIVAESSGHMIPLQQSELVVDTILEVIKQVK
jgi:pimeloyl-ACP methyl ester carboxylesterase